MALEDVAEARREREVHVVEVRHVDDVVDELAAVGALDRHDLPDPVGVGVGADAGQLRAAGCRGRPREPSTSCHTEQLVVDDRGLVLLGARAQRHPAGVGDRLALAVAAPAPVVERAGDLVALDRALGQVAAHVPAVAVEHVELALASPARRRACRRTPRCACGLPSAKAVGQPEAVPPAREARRRRALVEHPGLAHDVSLPCRCMTSLLRRRARTVRIHRRG